MVNLPNPIDPIAPQNFPTKTIDFASINEALLKGYSQVLKEWLPGGRIEGKEFICGNLDGKTGNSLKVNLNSGIWCDFATGEKGGDPISLYAAIHGSKQAESATELSEKFFASAYLEPKKERYSNSNYPRRVIPVPEPDIVPSLQHYKYGHPVQIWPYKNSLGQVLQYVARYEAVGGEKKYAPWTWNGTAWEMKHPEGQRPLYGLHKLATSPDSKVIICEGEKSADAVERIFTAAVSISWSGGCNSVKKADWQELQGRNVIIWPDADEPGKKAANELIGILEKIAISVKVLDVSDKPEKWDAANAEEDGWLAEEVAALLERSVLKTVNSSLPAKTYNNNFDPRKLPTRKWIIKNLLLRGYITAAIAPPGVGKSLVALLVAVMVASGKKLLHSELVERTNVLYLNNEDDQDEIERRLAATCQHHGVPFDDFENRLFTLSGYGRPFKVAIQSDNKLVSAHPDKEKIISFCRSNHIGLIVMDPFISIHDVPENDNTLVDKVATELRSVAKETGAALLLVHHTRKTGKDTELHAGDEQSGRGAYSLIGAVRIAFTLARMSKETAAKLNLDWNLGNRLVRLDEAKANYALKADKEDWYELITVTLPNGDKVGVPAVFNLREIKSRLNKKKEEEKNKSLQSKRIEIATFVGEIMRKDTQTQADLLQEYSKKKNIKRSVANADFKLLPINREDAVTTNIGGEKVSIWKENHSNTRAPRYIIHRVAAD